MKDEITDLIANIDGIPVPAKVKENTIKALAKGVGDLLTNLIEIPNAYLERISFGIRTKTTAEAVITKATAEAAAEEIKKTEALRDRAVVHFSGRILLEQKNREAVALKTLEQLKRPDSANTTQSIDSDWLDIFWRIAETKSNKEIQEFLSVLLTKEIRNPGNVSPHTLQLLSILTTETAKKFEALANLSIYDGKNAYVIHPHVFAFQAIGPLNQYGVGYDDLFELDGAGLIRSAEALMLNYAPNPDSGYEEVDYAGSSAQLKLDGKQVRLIQFTKPGLELRNLVSLKRNDLYTKTLVEQFKENIIL